MQASLNLNIRDPQWQSPIASTDLLRIARCAGSLSTESIRLVAEAIRTGCHGALVKVQSTENDGLPVNGPAVAQDSIRVAEAAGAAIPLLDEIIGLAKTQSDSFRVVVQIDTPLDRASERPWVPLVDSVLSSCGRGGFLSRVILTSYDWSALVYARSVSERLNTWFMTIPSSWFDETNLLADDVPQCSAYRARIGALLKSGDPPWFAGADPRRYAGSVPMAIRALGGVGWLVPVSDVARGQFSDAAREQLRAIAWCSGHGNAERLQLAVLTGASGLCLEQPAEALEATRINTTRLLSQAGEACRIRDWERAAIYCGYVVDRDPRKAPPRAYSRLGIAQRMLRDFSGSQRTLELGLRIHPKSVGLLSELAVLHMCRGAWADAVDTWLKCLAMGHLNALDYNRSARACEAAGRWDLHERIVSEGLAQFPDNEDLQARGAYAQAHRHLAQGCWQDAKEMFALLGPRAPKLWPFATLLYEKHAEINLELSAATTDQDRLEVLRTAQSTRMVLPRPQQYAGISLALELARSAGHTGDHLANEIRLILEVMQNFDTDIKSLDNPWVRDRVSSLARAATPEAVSSLTLPGPYYRVLARTLLRYGHWPAYWVFRQRYVASLLERRIDATTPVSYSDFVDQVVLANELGDHNYFEQLDAIAGKYSSTPDADWAAFLWLSRMCHGKHCAEPRPWTDADAKFAAMIRGKSVAIVGPAAGEEEVGEEIDSFDWVVRFNHRTTVQYAPQKFGTRTNFSWYISSDLPAERNTAYVDGMNSLDYVVLDKWAWKKCPWLEEVTAPKRNRLECWRATVNPQLFGSPNGVQRVLMDVLRFNAVRVKVFNSNLFLGERYSAGYRRYQKDLCPALSLHDPVSNFLYLKRLVELGVLEADSGLSNVLLLDGQQYVEAMESRYGHGPEREVT